MAENETPKGFANSLAGFSPARSRTRILRRAGWAMAWKTSFF